MAEFAYKIDRHVPCYHPLKGFFGKEVNPKTGRRPVVFTLSEAYSGVPVLMPCGQCIGCKLERSRQWAVRIVQEMRVHSESAFLTLTYSDAALPGNGSLVLRDLQLFMKRLRKQRPTGLRFYACGEYGESTGRPHYHVLLLNTGFPDRVFWKKSGEHNLYVSAELSKLWSSGDHFIGDVSFRSAAYVARYCTKKITGPLAEAHYRGRTPEFSVMSRRPGLGYEWFRRYGEQAFRLDSVVSDGREQAIPRYYQSKFESDGNSSSVKTRDDYLTVLKVKRRRKVNRADNTPERRRVRERVTELNLAMFKREK